ncbi:MAG: FeoA family protein [Halothiobacillus sp.]|jgi:ferrous iron transport protein A|nr:FeoA family protein [Halothiobacillus sp.]HUX82655.1 FeoA family protein [Halothiobacillus sp.]
MTEAIHLTMLKPTERGVVRGFAPGDAHYRRRLMAMGLTPGTAFTVTRLAPLGDPIQIEVRNSALTLRKDEAMMLRIDRLI